MFSVSYIASRALHTGADLHERGVSAVHRIGALRCFGVLFVVGALLMMFTSVWLFVGIAVFGIHIMGAMCRDLVNRSGMFNSFSIWRVKDAEMRKEMATVLVSFAPVLGGVAAALSRPLFEGVGQ